MRVEDQIKRHMAHWRKGDSAPDFTAREISECLVAYARCAIAERLREGPEQELNSWWQEYGRSPSDLRHDLISAMKAGNAIDVLVYAAMIYVRVVADEPGDPQ